MPNDVEMPEQEAGGSQKRNTVVDPDTTEDVIESKRPRIALDCDEKLRCLFAILDGYQDILLNIFPAVAAPTDPSTHVLSEGYKEASRNINVSIQVTNIIFTLHRILRQSAFGRTGNTGRTSSKTDFTITFKGADHNISREEAIELWKAVTTKNQLKYEKFETNPKESWYETFRSYIVFFCGFGLRMKELRVGHSRMSIRKHDGVLTEFEVERYGINGTYHCLLEGCTFPPEKRSSMAQCVGPLTAVLCMLISKGNYRNKWAAAVKRAYNHIPCIDDFIEITKTHRRAYDVSTTVRLLAAIALIAPTGEANHMYFPVCFLAALLTGQDKEKQKQILSFFNTSGCGGFFVYKMCSHFKGHFTASYNMSDEMIGEAVYHSIFGTFKEDLGVLSEITNIKKWSTREEMGNGFSERENGEVVAIKLPILNYYSKMSAETQSHLSSEVYTQVSSIPGFRTRHIGQDFTGYTEGKPMRQPGGKTLSQINTSLLQTLKELIQKVKDDQGKVDMGTVQWRKMADLELNLPGSVSDLVVSGTGQCFMSRSG